MFFVHKLFMLHTIIESIYIHLIQVELFFNEQRLFLYLV